MPYKVSITEYKRNGGGDFGSGGITPVDPELHKQEDEYDFTLDALIVVASWSSKAWLDLNIKPLLEGKQQQLEFAPGKYRVIRLEEVK